MRGTGRRMNKEFYATHKESWTFPQDQCELADYFANEWNKEGRTVHIMQDSGSIKVESFMLIRYYESGEAEKGEVER